MPINTTYQSFPLPVQEILLEAEPDIDGHSDAFEACWPNMFLNCPAFGWLFWTGTHWEQKGAGGALQDAIVQMLYLRRHIAVDNDKEALLKSAKVTRSNKQAIKEHLANRLYIGPEAFDNEPYKLNCRNGVVGLADGGLEKHYARAHRFTYCIDVDYDPTADTSIVEKHFREDLADPVEMVPFLKRAFGYSLTGSTREEKLFYPYGPSRSGKDTGIGAFLKMLGSPLAREVNFETLTNTRYGDTNRADIATLKPARFVLASESERIRQMNAATIKNLSGGNDQFVAYKHRDHFSYTPQFKMWLVSNWPVNVDVEDNAAWGRVVLIEFPNGHLGSEDPKRKEFTRSEDFQTALLAWAVEGAKEWLASGLHVPKCAEIGKKKQRDQLDSIGAFLSDCVQRTPFGHETNADMYAAYKNWCVDNGHEPRKHKSFSTGMKRLGHTINPKFLGGKTVRVWEEVQLA